MVKAKDITAKEAPKARVSKAREKAAEKALLEGALTEAPAPLDAEARKTRLKNLIKLGKERGYLTYAEINDHLPDDVVDAESIEAIISTFSEMSIQVFDEAPAAEDMLMSDTAAAVTDDEEVEAQAEQALSTVDSEFGRTTDPVRMYMREMGSVELLTREGEIEIAKRIEDGLKHMVQAISACPTTIADIIDTAARVEADEMRIDELVDGLIDLNADSAVPAAELPEEIEEAEEEEAEDDGGAAAVSASLLQLKMDALERFATIKDLHVRMQRSLASKGSQDKTYLKLRQQISDELMNIRFTSRSIERLCDSVRGMVDQVRSSERKIQQICVDRVKMPRPHFIHVFPGNETNLAWVDAEIAAAPKTYVAILTRSAPDIKEEQKKLIALQEHIGIPLKDLKDINKQMFYRRSQGPPRQARNDRSQPAPGHLDRQEVHQPRTAVPRPDPGRQHRPDEGSRQVRIPSRLQVLDLRHVVDPPGDHPLDCRPGTHHPHPGAHDRDDQQDEPDQPPDPAGDRRRARSRDAGAQDGDARGQDPQDHEDLQGAHLHGNPDRRR